MLVFRPVWSYFNILGSVWVDAGGLRGYFDDDNKLLYQLIDTAQKLCMEIVRTDDIAVLNSDKKTYKTAVLYAVAYLYENREKADHNAMKLTLRALLASYRPEAF